MFGRKKNAHEVYEEVLAQAPITDDRFIIYLPESLNSVLGSSVVVYPESLEAAAQHNKALDDNANPNIHWSLVWVALNEYDEVVTNAIELDYLIKTQNFLTIVQPFPSKDSEELYTSKENINLRTISGYSWRS